MSETDLTDDSTNDSDTINIKRENSEKKFVNHNFLAAKASITNAIEQQKTGGTDPRVLELQNERRIKNTNFNAARASFASAIDQQKPLSNIESSQPDDRKIKNTNFAAARSSFVSQSEPQRRRSSAPNIYVDDNNVDLSSPNGNKNWEEDIAKRKLGSVKDISSRFTGNSKVETMEAYERRVRGYKNLKTINYFRSQKTGLKSLSKNNKLRIMNEWKNLHVDEKMGNITSDAAKEFLSQYDLTNENLSNEQWDEWLDAIEVFLIQHFHHSK